MKNILYGMMGLALLMASCDTIEDRDSAGPVLTKDKLAFTVSQPTPGSNTIILESKTKDALPYWDWGTGFSNQTKDTIYIPFKGTFTIKYSAFSGGGTTTDSTTFTVGQNDEAYFNLNPLWKQLTGGGEGKTWVFAMDHPSGTVAGNGPEESVVPAWWTMSPATYNQSTTDDEITMDLKGAANFTRKHGDGSVEKGFFNMIDPYVKDGVTYYAFEVLGGPTFPWPATGKYHVTKITDDELSLHEYKAFNVALYKRKGFNY